VKILAVTNMYPTAADRSVGTFVEQQIKGLRDADVVVDVLHLDRLRQGAKVYREAGTLALRHAVAHGTDLVHVMYGGAMAERVASAVRELPVVVSFCGSDLLGEPLSPLKQRLFASVNVRLSHRAARRAAGVVVKAKSMLPALPSGLDMRKVRVIPNGVDLDTFRPLDHNECVSKLGWDPAVFHVLFPANAGNPVKRPALARAAVEILRMARVPVDFHPLQSVPHADVPLWLNASNVVLLTSEHEGSPNIIKEALACDRPVVSVDVGDVRERIEGIDGCYLTLPDANDIAAKLRLVCEHHGPVMARKSVMPLSLANVARELKRFYNDICESRKPVAPRTPSMLLAG
jgi:glycosyltransferase involved in cell wall biosynthesis